MTEEQKQMVIEHRGLVFLSLKQLNAEITDDILQEGYIGLIKGVKTFDESKGYKISSYLTTCIKNEVIREFNTWKQHKRRANSEAISIYDEIADGLTIIETLYSNINIEKEVLLKMEIERICDFVKLLKPSYREIIEYRYGLNGRPQLDSDEIAKLYGYSRQNVDNKLAIIYKKIRGFMKEGGKNV